MAVLVMAVASVPVAAPVLAGPEAVCSFRERVVVGLWELYGERQKAVFPSSGNTLIEVFASKASGTWTILESRRDGRSCIVASGQGASEHAVAPPVAVPLEL